MFKKLVGLLTVAVTGLFMASTASAAIDGSAHDFAGLLTGSGATTEICVVCHAPHENLNADGTLLWNRTIQTVGAYTAYDSPTLDGASAGPGTTSLLCLGCHDGTIAVDNYGTISTGNQFIDGVGGSFGDVAAFDVNLSNDHPIGVTYDTTATTGDAELNDAATAVTFQDASTGDINDMLQAGAVECASCHDVHDTVSNGAASLLVIANTNSALCTTCHNK